MEALRRRLEEAADLLERWDSVLGDESPLEVPRSLRTQTAVWLARRCGTDRGFSLFDAVRRQGYEPVLCAAPAEHPDALGLPEPGCQAAVLRDLRLALVEDGWDVAYSAAHEIAEDRYSFQHSAEMFAEQANILSSWLRALAASKGHGAANRM